MVYNGFDLHFGGRVQYHNFSTTLKPFKPFSNMEVEWKNGFKGIEKLWIIMDSTEVER